MHLAKIKKVFLLIFFAAASLISAQTARADESADSVNFKITAAPETLTVGDQLTVRILADYPENIKLTEPAMGAIGGNLVLKSGPTLKSKSSGGLKHDEYTLVLLPFETGDLEIPALEFFWYDSTGNQHTVLSPSKSVFVKSLLPADTAGLDIKDIVGPKALARRWWPYIIALLALLVLGGAGYWLYRRRIKAVAIPEAPPEPPYDVAIRSLSLLKEKNLPAAGKIKQYYIELSDIIRRYIEGRFAIAAIESTTYELKRALIHPDLTRDNGKLAIEFLIRSDMVKFAKHIPQPDECDSDFQCVKDVVSSTKPVEIPPEAQEVTA